MKDPTFTELWDRVTTIWKLRTSPNESARRAWSELCAYVERLYTSVVPRPRPKLRQIIPPREERPS